MQRNPKLFVKVRVPMRCGALFLQREFFFRINNGIMKTMKTIIKKVDKDQIDEKIIEEAGELLKRGGLVAFPTETVYGLAANALDPKASAAIINPAGVRHGRSECSG